jgi:pimeloyl-ACP methyl ester carboxylesterase
MLIVWGKNDVAFTERGAEAYKRDLVNVDLHFFETGHFALEDHGDEIAELVKQFLDRNATSKVGRCL